MTQDEMIELARQAGLLVIGTSNGGDAVYTWPAGITDEIEAFAKLVAEREREACAKVCETISNTQANMNAAWRNGCRDAATEIRARGQA